jgi:hypothetical protein
MQCFSVNENDYTSLNSEWAYSFQQDVLNLDIKLWLLSSQHLKIWRQFVHKRMKFTSHIKKSYKNWWTFDSKTFLRNHYATLCRFLLHRQLIFFFICVSDEYTSFVFCIFRCPPTSRDWILSTSGHQTGWWTMHSEGLHTQSQIVSKRSDTWFGKTMYVYLVFLSIK